MEISGIWLVNKHNEIKKDNAIYNFLCFKVYMGNI